MQRGELRSHVDAFDAVAPQQGGASVHGVGGQCQVDRPRADDRLVGDGQPAQGAGAEVRNLPIDLCRVDDLAVPIAVGDGLVAQAGQGVELLVVPGDQDGAGVLDRDAGVAGVFGQQPIAAADHRGFQRAGFGVEPGVQDRGVGLAGAVADIISGVEQRHRQLVAGQFAGDGRADDTGADHDDVMGGVHSGFLGCG